MIDELMSEYRERFDDTFPLMCCMDMTEDEIARRIRACLDSGEPLRPEDGEIY